MAGKLNVLVTGATGKQGGHVVRELLARGHSKFEVEKEIRRSGVPFTIVAPVFFMENVLADWMAAGVAAELSEESGRRVEYTALPIDAVRQADEDLARMYEWFDRVGYDADIVGLRAIYPEVDWHRFSIWAREQDWSATAVPMTTV
jgi:NmrA-like family